jgi:hypothetical protein
VQKSIKTKLAARLKSEIEFPDIKVRQGATIFTGFRAKLLEFMLYLKL